jgi:hypothetical protein
MIEAGEQRKMALIQLVEAVSTLHLALTPGQNVPLYDLKAAAQSVCTAYCTLQNLEIAGISAMLQDLEAAKKQAESPILQAGMTPRRPQG